MLKLLFVMCALVTSGIVGWGTTPARAQDAVDRTILPLPEPKFEGTIGKTYKESQEAWPKLPTAPEGAPNIIIVLLDDVGFGQVSTFGGPVPTPALDQLAANEIGRAHV